MAWKPTVMHFSDSSRNRLCGEKFRPWPEKYMSDEYARTLPLCPKCVAIREEMGKPIRQAPEPQPEAPEPRVRKGVFLADYRLPHIKEQQRRGEETA